MDIHDVHIEAQNLCYLVISGNSCKGCVGYSSDIMRRCKDVVIVTTLDNELMDVEGFAGTLLLDTLGRIDRLNIQAQNTTVIRIESGEITDLISVTPSLSAEGIEEILNKCNCK